MVAFEAIPDFDASESNFAVEYGRALSTQETLTKREKKILEIIREDPSKRRTKKLKHIEGHVRARMGINPHAGAIDWSTIKWPEWLKPLAELWEMIWPLIKLLFFAGESDDNVSVPFVLGANQVPGANGNTVASTGNTAK